MMKKIREWLDRRWNLFFHKDKVWELTFLGGDPFRYNDIIVISSGDKHRCLGKNWFKIMKSSDDSNSI